MKNFISLLLTSLVFTTFVSAANAQNKIIETPIKQVSPTSIKTPINLKPTKSESEALKEDVIVDVVIDTMKIEKVFTKSTANYFKEFKKILSTYKTIEPRAKAIAILDKKYPKTSKQVSKYFIMLKDVLSKTEQPVVITTPAIDYKKEYFALLDEMKEFVLQLQKSKIRLEILEKKLDDMRR